MNWDKYRYPGAGESAADAAYPHPDPLRDARIVVAANELRELVRAFMEGGMRKEDVLCAVEIAKAEMVDPYNRGDKS
jgi:hypothetical protein